MMKNLAIVTVFSLITATVSFTAEAGHGRGNTNLAVDSFNNYGQQREKLVLNINQTYRGLNIIRLKQELQYNYPGRINVRNLDLIAVKLVAKSAMGRGEATLLVGQNASYPERVAGNPGTFNIDAPATFDKIKIQNPSFDSMGKWQIELRGLIKVKKVVLIVKNKRAMGQGRTLRIPMYDQYSRGNQIVRLKQLVAQNNPGVNLQNMQLETVTLVAKSKMGRASASLLVGHTASYPAIIAGTPRAFHTAAPRSYFPITLMNPSFDSMGKWQIQLQGEIKVKEILVTLKSNRGSVRHPGQVGRGRNGQPVPRRRGRGRGRM